MVGVVPTGNRRSAKPMRNAPIILFLPLLALLFSVAAQAADLAGHITRLKGAATLTSGQEARAGGIGAELFAGDVIVTEAATRVELTLRDDTVVTLGDNVTLTIDRYVYAPDAGVGEGLLTLAAGAFRAVTGRLAKMGAGSFQVETPVAIVGIRGTEFWGELGSEGLLIALLGGKGVFVENAAGRVEITTQHLATQVTSAAEAPAAPFALTDAQLAAALATVAW